MPIAAQGRCRAAATIMQVAAERVAGVFAACWHAYASRRERTAAVRELRALDDRTLRDIGINRSEIESVVYGQDTTRLRGRDDPAADCRRAETRPSRTTASKLLDKAQYIYIDAKEFGGDVRNTGRRVSWLEDISKAGKCRKDKASD